MSDKFESWGIVELMGHQQAAGRLSEQVIGGGNLLRVDIPLTEDTYRTVYYGGSAIYALHVTDEAVARQVAKKMDRKPPYAYVLETPRLQAAGAYEADEPENDEPY